MFSITKKIKKKKVYCVIDLKTLKYHTFSKKQFFLLLAVSVRMRIKKYLKRENELRY